MPRTFNINILSFLRTQAVQFALSSLFVQSVTIIFFNKNKRWLEPRFLCSFVPVREIHSFFLPYWPLATEPAVMRKSKVFSCHQNRNKEELFQQGRMFHWQLREHFSCFGGIYFSFLLYLNGTKWMQISPMAGAGPWSEDPLMHFLLPFQFLMASLLH